VALSKLIPIICAVCRLFAGRSLSWIPKVESREVQVHTEASGSKMSGVAKEIGTLAFSKANCAARSAQSCPGQCRSLWLSCWEGYSMDCQEAENRRKSEVHIVQG